MTVSLKEGYIGKFVEITAKTAGLAAHLPRVYFGKVSNFDTGYIELKPYFGEKSFCREHKERYKKNGGKWWWWTILQRKRNRILDNCFRELVKDIMNEKAGIKGGIILTRDRIIEINSLEHLM